MSRENRQVDYGALIERLEGSAASASKVLPSLSCLVTTDDARDAAKAIRDLEQVSRELDEAVRLLRAIDDGYARPDVGHEDFRVQVKLWTDAFLNNLDNRNE